MSTWLATFSTASPWTFCLLFCPMVLLGIVVATWSVSIPLDFVLKLWCRWLRSRNIKHHGWPPSHLDADDDFKKEDQL